MAAKPRPPQTPNYRPPVYVAPPLDYLPPGVKAREIGRGEMPPPAEQLPRRLVVDDGDGAAEFVFDPLGGGGVITVIEPGRSPDPILGGACAGVFSPFSTVSMYIAGEPPDRRLIVVEQLGEPVERVIPIDDTAAPSLLVEVRLPTPGEPWTEMSQATRFDLDRVKSVLLEDVASGDDDLVVVSSES